jgi:hypothetical protein
MRLSRNSGPAGISCCQFVRQEQWRDRCLQAQESLETELFAANAVVFEQQPHNIYAGHSNSLQAQESLETELFAANAVVFEQQPHNIYAGHSNSLQAQESLETELFAANAVLSEPRQFD